MTDLSKWVRSVRKKTGMTQAEFGEAVGVSEWSVCAWESEREKSSRSPSKTAQKVIKMLEAEHG